jgi:quinol monooxygenase YgiN
MIAVIFEVVPATGRKTDYLEHAARLKGELERMDGFISVERFQSLTDPDKLLSLSFWRDDEAVAHDQDPRATLGLQGAADRKWGRITLVMVTGRNDIGNVGEVDPILVWSR